MENGTPERITLIAMEKLFGVSADYLMGKSECPNYTFEDITQKTGLSQKAIEKLYQLQHNYLLFEENIEIEIAEDRKISNLYREHINILNSILEKDVNLFWLLDNIKNYNSRRDEIFGKIEKEKKENSKYLPIDILDAKKELAELEIKIRYSFEELIKEIIKKKGLEQD